MKKEIIKKQKFEGKDVTFRIGETTSEVLIDDVARFCGWEKVETTSGRQKKSIRWNRINEYLKELGVDHKCNKDDYIPEFIMYALIGKARNERATKFMLWVGTVLTELRTKGVVILENATKEAIKFEDKFGKYRIRKTFLNSNDVAREYKEFLELSKAEWKAKRLNNFDRVKLSNLICKGLEQRLDRDKIKLKPSEMLGMQELIADIKSDIIKLENKKNGGIKTHQSKEIKKLKCEVKKFTSIDKDFIVCNCHPLSNNYMYQVGENGTMEKTKAYKQWIKYFPYHNVPDLTYWIAEGVDFSKPVELFMNVVIKDKFDVVNFEKSFIDMIFNRIYKIDDYIVRSHHMREVGRVENFADGKVAFYIRNLEPADMIA
ncbi:MAG: hypothetical protein ACRC28_00905 [Clostridium sp.]|uniref:hypothetical protein n=1 Tax=Clostridia TaxID=186801 RepID=UPI003F362B63